MCVIHLCLQLSSLSLQLVGTIEIGTVALPVNLSSPRDLVGYVLLDLPFSVDH